MSAMTKHIGTEIDFPSMGSCVGGPEIGYLYGQVYRRGTDGVPTGSALNLHASYSIVLIALERKNPH